MQLSKYVEAFILFFNRKISQSENKSPWMQMTLWKTLENQILDAIYQKLMTDSKNSKPHLSNDASLFQTYVRNVIDVNKNELNTHVISSIANINIISEEGTNIIKDYLSLKENTDIKPDINSNDDFVKARLIMFTLLIPIAERWRTALFSDIYKDIERLNKLLETYKIQYSPGMDMRNYVNSILYNNMLDKKDMIVYDVIKYLNSLRNEYKKLDALNKMKAMKKDLPKTSHPLVKKDVNNDNSKINKTDVKRDIRKDHSKISHPIMKKDIKGDTSKSSIHPVKKEIPKKQIEIDLDTLKIQGLRDLCVKMNISTSSCSKRQDYLNLLLPYTK